MTGRKEKPWRSKTPVISSKSDHKVSDDSICDQMPEFDSDNATEFSLPNEISKPVDEVKSDVDKWKSGEKILCFHGPLIYEAKIQNLSGW